MDRVARFETFARIGFLARGIVYLLLGYFALTTAGGEGATSVLEEIGEAPAGGILLVLLAIGLVGYSLFRLASAALDLEGAGPGIKGAIARGAQAVSGVTHFVLAWIALGMAVGSRGGGSGGQGEGEAAQEAMTYPGGEALVLIVGLWFLAAGAEQMVKAWTSKFMRGVDASAPRQVEWLGRAGYAARGVVFLIVGWQIVQAARGEEAGRLGFEPALASLQGMGWIYTAVAVGLLLFGAFSLALARWHRICDEHVIARLRAKVGA
ncbi:MAG: DUF1206 domain-containing protein [Sphingomonadaceae bacterium]|nr:DUF1206 domain-containing protein [Sphingomonadaceae bacterium]